MIELELNTKKIAKLGKKNEKDNLEFRVFLKGQDFEKVDRIVQRLNNEISSQIDCQTCGNCCKNLKPCVTDSEIINMAQTRSLKRSEFESIFVEKETNSDVKFLKNSPCTFLLEKSCSIYNIRPEECKSYPHTHKPNFISRTFVMIDNYSICPIVYNVFERLKSELKYK
jgi:uncharacterized protein